MNAGRLFPTTARALALLAAAASAACSARGVPPTLEPQLADEMLAATAPRQPLRVIFEWRAQERDARFSGRGVARVQDPYRARLDLFGPRGDSYLSAAMVDREIRMPPGVQATQLPPPAMMWAVLGVVLPPADAVLLGTAEGDGRVELHYDAEGARLRYRVEDGRLRSAEWEGGGRRMSVELRGSAEHGLPREAIYRDWAGYTELVLNLESVDEVDPFPTEIWTPGS